MKFTAILIASVVCLACFSTVSSVELDLVKRLHTKKGLVAASRVKSHRQEGNEDVRMCQQILNTIFGNIGVGSSMRELTEQQALACWCLWSKTTRASALTNAIFQFYSPVPATSIGGAAKALLKASWKAYQSASSRGGTNLISRSFMAAYSRSAAEGCFGGEDLMGGCSMLTDRCQLWDCYTAPDGTKWYNSPVGDCERSSTISRCSNAGCRPKPSNRCPVGDDTRCRCDSGHVYNSCTCVTKLPRGAETYCARTAALSTM